MANIYVVRQGDCMSSIAKQHGFTDWKTIYYHPENAEFRRKRRNPNHLYPGDSLFIPDIEIKHVDRPTDQRHRFVVKRAKTRIRMRIEDGNRRPAAGKRYALEIGGKRWEGTTDGDGLVESVVPADAEDGNLTVWLSDAEPWGISWKLKIGHLDPLDEITGVQGRLMNTGFYYGPVDGQLSQQTRSALQAFQGRLGLEPRGDIDEVTGDKLRELHDTC